MMRSMYSGVSGLKTHQTKMDIIGNNIANVNTVGFKSQRATFQEVFSQTIKGAGSPQTGKGGTNAQQIGLGISLSTIDTLQNRGAVQRTDNTTDLAINGDGFFIISDSADCLSRSYTRAGNFSLDEMGNLVTSSGYKVLGYMADTTTGVLKSSLEGIQISKAMADDAQATSSATFEGNLDNALAKYTGSDASITLGTPDVLNIGTFDEARQATAQYYDSLGGQHNIQYTFIRGMTADGKAGGADTEWAVLVKDLDTGKYLNHNGDLSIVNATDIADAIIPLKFTADGKIDSTTTSKYNIGVAGVNGSNNFSVDVDFSALTQFANESTASVTNNGYKQGSLDSYTIAATGEITGTFTNGIKKVIGQIALAIFKNPSGLEKTSENMYQISNNSGDAIICAPSEGGAGALNPSTLEMSNVDISNEFTDMISTQRGFQANSRIITTSDQMLEELVNLKR